MVVSCYWLSNSKGPGFGGQNEVEIWRILIKIVATMCLKNFQIQACWGVNPVLNLKNNAEAQLRRFATSWNLLKPARTKLIVLVDFHFIQMNINNSQNCTRPFA